MMAEPMETLELHYPMIQFLIKTNISNVGLLEFIGVTTAKFTSLFHLVYERTAKRLILHEYVSL